MADDLLLPSPCDGSRNPCSPVVAGSGENEETRKQIEGTLQREESVKFKARSSVHYLNRSLDWDIDFLTSEGVLNNDELANINSTFKKDEANSLSIVHEDSNMSVEKNSTYSDDAWSLEKLEIQLFENSHAKTQKILQVGKKASKLGSPSKKQIPSTGSALPHGSSRNTEPSCQTKKSSIAPRRCSVIYNHGHISTSSGVTVAKGDGEFTSSKKVPKPASILCRAPLPATPARSSYAPANTQSRNSTTKDKSGKVIMQKSVADPKKGNGIPTSASLKSSQSSNSKLNLVRNSSSTAHHTAQEKTRMKSTSGATMDHSSSEVITKKSSSASVANKVPSSGSITKASSRGTRIVNRSLNHPAKSTSSLKLSLSTSPSSSCESIASLSSSSTFCTTKSMDSDDSSSSSPWLEGVDDERAHSPVLKSSPASKDHKDNSHDVHVSKSTSGCHSTCTQSRGNHTIQSTENSSEANRSKPSGVEVYQTQYLVTPTSYLYLT